MPTIAPINAETIREMREAEVAERGRQIGCGCCVGPEYDRCCCHIHQDITRGLWAHKCSMHRRATKQA